MVDILFINPGQGGNYQGVSTTAPAIAPPTWILLLAEFCRRGGHEVAIYDANVRGWGAETAEILMGGGDPCLVVIWVAGHNPSASTQTMPIAGKIARDLKTVAPALPIAMGGVHPSALPDRTLAEEAVNYVSIGEGFTVVSDLAFRVRAGIGFPGNAKAILGSMVDPEADLNGYAWDLLDGGLDAYRAHDWHLYQDAHKSQDPGFLDIRSPYATLYTSLGCPHACNFCVIPGFFGPGKVRHWSPETVAGWIDELVGGWGVRNIRIEDELFLLEDRRTEEICDLLIDRGYDLNLFCYGRVREYPPELLRKMEKAGFTWISLGVESAEGKTNSGSVACVRAIQRAGMSVAGNFIFGLPGERQEDMEATLKLALELRCEKSNFYCCMPLPGSKLYVQAQREGWLPPSWEAYSQLGYGCQPMGTEYLTPAEVLSFRDHAYQDYHRSPEYLDYVRGRFGGKVVEHIKKMAGKEIPRLLRSTIR